MLSVSGSPTWRTVTGGSQAYVTAVAAQIDECRQPRGTDRYPDRALAPRPAKAIADDDADGDTKDLHQMLPQGMRRAVRIDR